MTAHRHHDDCWGEIDGRLICPIAEDLVDREHLERYVPESDERVPSSSWKHQREYAADLAPEHSAIIHALGCAVLVGILLGAAIAWLVFHA